MTRTVQKTEFGDWALDETTGRFATVADRDKARQDARDVLELWSGVRSLFGLVAQGPTIVQVRLSRQLRAAYGDLINLQSTFQRSRRTLAERIARVASVRVAQAENDPTRYVFAVALTTAAGESVAVGGQFPP